MKKIKQINKWRNKFNNSRKLIFKICLIKLQLNREKIKMLLIIKGFASHVSQDVNNVRFFDYLLI